MNVMNNFGNNTESEFQTNNNQVCCIIIDLKYELILCIVLDVSDQGRVYLIDRSDISGRSNFGNFPQIGLPLFVNSARNGLQATTGHLELKLKRFDQCILTIDIDHVGLLSAT